MGVMTPQPHRRPPLQSVVQVRLAPVHHDYLRAVAERLTVPISQVVRMLVERDMETSADTLFDRGDSAGYTLTVTTAAGATTEPADPRELLRHVLDQADDGVNARALADALATTYDPPEPDEPDFG